MKEQCIHIIPIKEARRLSMRKYFTGVPCKNGHFSERYVAGNNCVECQRPFNRPPEYAERTRKMQIEMRDKKIKEHPNFEISNRDTGLFLQIISRETARKLGIQWYFTGKPCKHGHFSPRQVNDNSCDMCSRARRRTQEAKNWHKRYREQNPDKVNKVNKEWRENNIDRKREMDRRWSQNNKEHRKAYFKDRVRNDPVFAARCRMSQMLHNLLRKTGKKKMRRTHKELGYSQEEFCTHIESRFLKGMSWEDKNFEIDHLHPVSRYLKDGVEDPSIINSLSNLAPMWPEHNRDKRDKTLEEWLKEKSKDSEEYILYSHLLDR